MEDAPPSQPLTPAAPPRRGTGTGGGTHPSCSPRHKRTAKAAGGVGAQGRDGADVAAFFLEGRGCADATAFFLEGRGCADATAFFLRGVAVRTPPRSSGRGAAVRMPQLNPTQLRSSQHNSISSGLLGQEGLKAPQFPWEAEK